MNETNTESLRDQSWGDMTPRDRRNERRCILILFVWLVAFAAATFLIRMDYIPTGPASWVVSGIPSLIALATALAFFRFLREADELQRAIQLQALALALWTGFVIWPAVQLLEKSGASFDFFISLADAPILGMDAAYIVGILLGRSRYQ